MGQARRFTRVEYQSEILIKAKDKWFRGLSENLSLYGIYIKSNTKFDIDSVVELTIPLTPSTTSDEDYVDISGIVVRQDEEGVGCHFQQIDVDAFLNLKNIVSSRCENKSQVMDEFYTYLARKELPA